MQIAPDPALFAFADLDDLALEPLGMLEKRDAGADGVMFFLKRRAADGDEGEIGKARGRFPDREQKMRINVAGQNIGPPPGDAAEDRDEEPGFAVAKPDPNQDRDAVKEREADLVAREPIDHPANEDEQQRLREESVVGLAGEEGRAFHGVIRSAFKSSFSAKAAMELPGREPAAKPGG